MPNIREFTPGALDIRPTETGIEAQAGAARRIGAFYNQASQATDTLGQRVGGAVRDAGDAYVKHVDHEQISALSSTGAALMNNYSTEWNDIASKADPNDPTALNVAAKKFREERLEPALAKWQEGATTENAQRFAQSFADRYRLHMFERTSADIAGHASDVAHANVQMTGNQLGNAVYNDPSSHNLDLALDTIDHTITSLAESSGMTAAQASKFKTEIGFQMKQHLIRSNIEGAIANGAPYQEIMNNPKYAPYVNQQEIDKFARDAKRQQNEERIQAEHLKALQKQNAESDMYGGIADIKSQHVKYDANTSREVYDGGTIPAMQALRNRLSKANVGINLGPIDTAIKYVQAEMAERHTAVVSNPSTRADLMSRIGASDTSFATRFSGKGATSDEEIQKAVLAGKLNPKEGQEMLALNKMKRERPDGEPLKRDRDEFLKTYVAPLDPMWASNAKSEYGQQKVYAATMDVYRYEQTLSAKGIDPHEAYDPTSPNFMGAKLDKHRGTLDDKMKFDAEQLKAAKAKSEAPTPSPNRSNPVTVRQNGHTYQRQDDGSYKAID